MKDITNFIFRITIAVGLPVVLIVLAAFQMLNMKLAIGIICAMGVVYVFHFLNKRPDERTKRLNAYAVKLSWIFTYFFLLAWYFIDHFKIVTLSSAHLISLIFFSMVYSYWMINFVVSGRSDISE